MCSFCEGLDYKIYKKHVRTTVSDDNVCAIINSTIEDFNGEAVLVPQGCSVCDGCYDGNEYFEIMAYNDIVDIGYFHKIKELTVHVLSERIKISYCPFCGKKLCTKE